MNSVEAGKRERVKCSAKAELFLYLFENCEGVKKHAGGMFLARTAKLCFAEPQFSVLIRTKAKNKAL